MRFLHMIGDVKPALAALMALAAAICAARGQGTTFDFSKVSAARFPAAATGEAGSLITPDAVWKPGSGIHTTSLANDSPLRMRAKRRDFIKATMEDGEMRIETLGEFVPLAEREGLNPGVLSGQMCTKIKGAQAGETYRVSFSYMMSHSHGKMGYCIIWQYDGKGAKIGKQTTFKLTDFDDDFISFSREMSVYPGAETLELHMRIDGIGTLRAKNVSFLRAQARRPIEVQLGMMGLLDNAFAVGEGQCGALTFAWRTTDSVARKITSYSLTLRLPAGFEYLGNAFSSGAAIEKAADGGSVITLPVRRGIQPPDRHFNGYRVLGVCVAANRGAGRGRAELKTFYEGKEIADPLSFDIFAVPPVRAAAAPKRILCGFSLGGDYSDYDAPAANRLFAQTAADSGSRCVVMGGDNPQSRIPFYRGAGFTRILPAWSGCANGYILNAKVKDIPEEARFKVRDPKTAYKAFTDRGICPQEIYGEGPFFRDVFLPTLKRILEGTDGLWANWEPYVFAGQGCSCKRCEEKRAAFAGEDHDFRSKEHAKVVKTIDKWVRRFCGEDSMGFVPGVSAKQMLRSWRRVYGKSEFKEYDYAASLKWIDPWGPYVYWDAQTPYARMMHPTLLAFAAARDVREATDADYGDKAPELMAFPQGTQGAAWITQPEYLEMEYDAHIFNRWRACCAYYFPRGYDARYWRAIANAAERAARYESFILDGKCADGTTRAEPPGDFPACRNLKEYIDGAKDVSLLRSAAFELGGERIVAVFNFADDRAADFTLKATGLPPGRYRVVREDGADFGTWSESELGKGISATVPATRTRVFKIGR